MRLEGATNLIWEHQGRSYQALVPPVKDQWYALLDEDNARVYFINAYQENDEDAPKNIELKMTIDGVGYGAVSLSQTHDVFYYWYVARDTISETMFGSTTFSNVEGGTYIEGKHIKVEARITSALGTNQTLLASVDWAQLSS